MTIRKAQPTTIAKFAALAMLAILVALVSRGDVPVASAGGCANANAAPNEASKSEFKKAIKCLINQERTSRGLNALKTDDRLDDIETAHVNRMVNQDCFDHRCAGEPTLRNRLFASGYLDGADSYRYGEILGYEQTPNEMIDRWMASDYHRNNILSTKFKDIGVGASPGAPVEGVSDGPFVTYGALMAVAKRP